MYISAPGARVSPKNGQAELQIDGVWSPICGHWFWNNMDGANLFCKEMTGKAVSAKITKRHLRLDSKAAIVGQCQQSDKSIMECTGNKPGASHCSAGNNAGVKIQCGKS